MSEDRAKLLGVTMSNYLPWNDRVSGIVKKASKCLYSFFIAEKGKATMH